MTIRAIYANGVFRPMEPVDLPENSPVRVEVEIPPPESVRKAMKGEDLLKFRNTVQWPEDPVEWQRRMRDEEWQ